MKEFLSKIRMPDKSIKVSKKIVTTILILILGIMFGCFSKWLDNTSINDSIWWQHILGVLDLRNVFSGFSVWICLATIISVFSKTPLRASLNVFVFFIGMTTSYHLYTILFSGFNPRSYMLIWYVITLITPILAYICWYAKGKGKISFLISVVILSVMMSAVTIGIGNQVVKALLFVITFLSLHTNTKRSIYNLLGSILSTILFNIAIYI